MFMISFSLKLPEVIAVTPLLARCCCSNADVMEALVFSKRDTSSWENLMESSALDWISGFDGKDICVLGVGEALLDTIAVFLSALKAGDVVRYTPCDSIWPWSRMEGADAIDEGFVTEEND